MRNDFLKKKLFWVVSSFPFAPVPGDGSKTRNLLDLSRLVSCFCIDLRHEETFFMTKTAGGINKLWNRVRRRILIPKQRQTGKK
jgi:hypothetical protein